jgi:crotonobetainyl-CoA:carnitine CoA-transferase CaiB-like acyl-CoA transferase
VQPPRGRERDWWNTCAYFQEYSRNKRSLALEIAHPRGREVLAALVRRADVVIENYRAGVLDRLGIGYDWLRAQRGDVILVSMAAFGQTGPDCERPGYGPVMEELSGLASLTGWGDGRPQLAIGYAYGDPVAAAAAAGASLAALLQRRRTGLGQHVDLAQFDVLVAMIGDAFAAWSRTGREPAQRGNRRAGCAPHGVYPCAGVDEWVAIAVESDAHWRGLRRALGDPEWARDPALDAAPSREARASLLDDRIAAWTRGQRKSEVFERCIAEGVPAAPVHRTNHELIENPQLRARGFYERVSHPAGGEWWMHGWEWRPAGAGRCVRALAPDFGADNDAVLREVAGLSDREIAALRAEGVIASMPIGVPALPEDR